MRRRTGVVGFILMVIVCACGGQASEAGSEAVDSGAADAVAAAPQANAAADQTTVGAVRVEIDGVESRFGYVSAAGSAYTPLASTIEARREAGSTEQFAIRLLQVDLKKLSFPIDLPGTRDLTNPTDLTGGMATIGFGYVDADGEEWAGPGKIHIESFGSDGTIRGTFDGVTLPHVDDELADIALTNGSFEARISTPW